MNDNFNSQAYPSGMNMGMQQQMPQNNFGQPRRPTFIPGRVIDTVQEITPQEVPMDGSVAFFPSRDYSVVYSKFWNQYGTISTDKYVKEVPNAPTQKPEEADPFQTEVLNRLEQIEKKLNKPQFRPNNNRKPPYNKPKEGDSNV